MNESPCSAILFPELRTDRRSYGGHIARQLKQLETSETQSSESWVLLPMRRLIAPPRYGF